MNIRAQVQRLLVEGVPIKRQEVGGGAICLNFKFYSQNTFNIRLKHLTISSYKTLY